MVFPVVITEQRRRIGASATLFAVLLACCTLAWAESSLTYEDFAHPNRGCPENSECDAEMGRLLREWRARTERWSSELPREQRRKELAQQMAKGGWPVEFYTVPSAKGGFNPVQYASPCTHHNPRGEGAIKTTRGLAFIKGTDKGEVVVARGETEFRIKPGPLLKLRTVYLLPEKAAPVLYQIPLDETPYALQGDKLLLLAEAEGPYVMLSIPPEGNWSVDLPPEKELSDAMDSSEEVACPAGTPAPEAPWFQRNYCRHIRDLNSGKKALIQLGWSC